MKILGAKSPEAAAKQKELLVNAKNLFIAGTVLNVMAVALSALGAGAFASSLFFPPLLFAAVPLALASSILLVAGTVCVVVGYILMFDAKELGDPNSPANILGGAARAAGRATEMAKQPI